MSYNHLTQEQRSQIQALKSMGHTQDEIAHAIGVHPSTISRELKRNTGLRGYRYQQANRLAKARRSDASTQAKKMTVPIVAFIEKQLVEEQWSPEQISGVLSANGHSVSHTCIYQHVWSDKDKGGTLYKHLRHRGKKYNYKGGKKSGRGCIPNRVDISERAKIVEKKIRLGDWEADTIVGAKHQGAIVSLVERKSKFTLLALVKNSKALTVTEAIVGAFARAANLPVYTMTYDNGKEFSLHEEIAKAIGGKSYFATPYHSWERGLNEHTNGLVRQYLPKKTNFHEVDEQVVLNIEAKLNSRPRKVLGYRTPIEVLQGKSSPQKIELHG